METSPRSTSGPSPATRPPEPQPDRGREDERRGDPALIRRYDAACASTATTYNEYRALVVEFDDAADAASNMGQRMALRDNADDCRARAEQIADQVGRAGAAA